MSETKTKWSNMKLKQRTQPTDLYCRNCLEQVVSLEISALQDSDYPSKPFLCENCKRKWMRAQVLTFDEMTEAKFEQVKQRNINILKGDMRP